MIQLENIHKYYKDTLILEDFNLQIKSEKNIVSLIGSNGAGKSTLLRLLSGILLPSKGLITMSFDKEKVIKDWEEFKKEVIFIPASERILHYKLSVKDNIIYFNTLKGMSKEKIIEKYKNVMEEIGFMDFQNRLIETLSTGEKKKTLIAAALCSDCKVIILDEPTIGLDIDAKDDLKNILLNKDICNDKLFIISSHDFDFLENLSEENIFISKGKIVDQKYEKLSRTMMTEIYQACKIS